MFRFKLTVELLPWMNNNVFQFQMCVRNCSTSHPGHMNFWNLICSNSLTPGQKFCSNAPSKLHIRRSNAPVLLPAVILCKAFVFLSSSAIWLPKPCFDLAFRHDFDRKTIKCKTWNWGELFKYSTPPITCHILHPQTGANVKFLPPWCRGWGDVDI